MRQCESLKTQRTQGGQLRLNVHTSQILVHTFSNGILDYGVFEQFRLVYADFACHSYKHSFEILVLIIHCLIVALGVFFNECKYGSISQTTCS